MEPTPAPTIDLRAPCRHLRSKEMFHSATGAPDDEFSSGVYWCQKTCEAFGPDGELADKTRCCNGRSCYLL
jgi:hypothetical protein